jgi:hypothetical protein
MPLAAVPLVEELRDRSVLDKPLLRPRYLDDPATARRLDRIENAHTVLDLLEG